MTQPERTTEGLEHLLRDLAPQVLGPVVRRFGDFAASEDAVQEALLAAAKQWPEQGVPDNPRAWLIRVALRRMTDWVRAETARLRRQAVAVEQAPRDFAPAPDDDADPAHDDSLALLFMCCHPSLTTPSAIALTLRAVGGLTTAEIAAAFLVPESTMAQRISRAKQTIRASGVPFEQPGEREWRDRLGAVLHVVYLIFNEGYTTSAGPALHRPDLTREAIRLARAVRRRLPEDAEVAGLLALMLLTDARRAARTDAGGALVPLAEQDRTRWDRDAIAEGVALVEEALPRGAVGAYQLQAAIAALHDEAEGTEETDWPQILALYGLLERVAPGPVVTLNRAVALAMVEGPAAAHALIDGVADDPRLAEGHRLPAVRAHLFEMAGDTGAAIAAYRLAASRASNLPERDYLMTRAAGLKKSETTE